MMAMSIRSCRSHSIGRQQGAVLFVAMVVLVALAIAALALLRSVDVAGLLAGNLSFKRSSLNSADLGYQQAFLNFNSLSAIGRNSDQKASCYSSTQKDVDAVHGVPLILGTTSSFDNEFPGCLVTGVDTTETVRFYIDRLCTTTGAVQATTCGSHNVQQNGMQTGTKPLTATGPLYRVTVRVDGPRNTTTYTQFIAKA